MVLLIESVGTCTTTSGNLMDLSQELSKHAKTGGNRYLHSACFITPNGALDAKVELKYKRGHKTDHVATLYGTATVKSMTDDDMLPISFNMRRNGELQMFCTEDAGAESFIALCIRNRPSRRRRRRR